MKRSKSLESDPSSIDKLFEENLRIVFDVLSSGKNGKISLTDFHDALLAFGQPLSEKALISVFSSRGHPPTLGDTTTTTVSGDTTSHGTSTTPKVDLYFEFEEFKNLVKEKASDSRVLTMKSLVERLLLNEDIVVRMMRIRAKTGYLCDMDGVIYRGGKLLPGVKRFLAWVKRTNKKLLFITNNSKSTPAQLQAKLSQMGLDMPREMFFTAALSCAAFLHFQKPHGCTAYCVGGIGIQEALKEKGVTLTEDNPDYVVIGESDIYTTDQIKTATRLVDRGSKLIGTNIDVCGPVEDGIEPSCGAWTSVVEVATKKKAYFTGKPNPFMMRAALKILECHSSEISMIGDRMDTDCIAGIESMVDPILVLSGVSTIQSIEEFPYRPYIVLNGVGEIPPDDFQE